MESYGAMSLFEEIYSMNQLLVDQYTNTMVTANPLVAVSSENAPLGMSTRSVPAALLQPTSKPSQRPKRAVLWALAKNDVYRLYITEEITLPATMAEIEKINLLKARYKDLYLHSPVLNANKLARSLRTWKTKIKEWGFDKYLSKDEMAELLAKKRKRALVDGKETVFLYHGLVIKTERIENFKRRKTTEETTAPSPSAG